MKESRAEKRLAKLASPRGKKDLLRKSAREVIVVFVNDFRSVPQAHREPEDQLSAD